VAADAEWKEADCSAEIPQASRTACHERQ
jgi:hypothetical protein